MLDDIWKEVNLEAIGVPIPTKDNEYKVAFTTRFRDVCVRMRDPEPMQVKCLEEEEAWKLFEDVVGANTLRNDPIIEQLARKVAEKCDGLPLALSVIGKTMACKDTVQEWEHVVEVLTGSAAEYPGVENILSVLKYSYDSLGDEHIKSCFLYCALFPEDDITMKEDFIEYWLCEGFIGDTPDLKRAINKGYDIFGTLIRANLLTATSGTSGVVMHDVVRDMALWIASDFAVHTNMGLYEMPTLKDWDTVRRMSLVGNKIKEITCSSKYSNLTTLFLHNNNLKNLSGEFIQSMQNLVVLDLSENQDFNTLPEHISKLVSLKFINLSYTSIEQLPVGFQELKRLINLNLSNIDRLRSISGISKLSSLRILDLRESSVHGDITLLEELQHLKHLQDLRITISTDLGLDQILSNQKFAKCITGLHILGFQQKPINISLLVKMKNLRYLKVDDSLVLENITDIKYSESPCFGNLIDVEIVECSGIKDMTWLLIAPNLVSLSIDDLEEVEEIINKEKATNLTGITPFQKLEVLELEDLPQLKSIYWSPLPFPSLITLSAIDCPKLRKLPLNASSAPQADDIDIEFSSPEQLSEFEWEDEETKARFLPFTTNMLTTDDDSTNNSDDNPESGDDNTESGDDNTESGDDTE